MVWAPHRPFRFFTPWVRCRGGQHSCKRLHCRWTNGSSLGAVASMEMYGKKQKTWEALKNIEERCMDQQISSATFARPQHHNAQIQAGALALSSAPATFHSDAWFEPTSSAVGLGHRDLKEMLLRSKKTYQDDSVWFGMILRNFGKETSHGTINILAQTVAPKISSTEGNLWISWIFLVLPRNKTLGGLTDQSWMVVGIWWASRNANRLSLM